MLSIYITYKKKYFDLEILEAYGVLGSFEL